MHTPNNVREFKQILGNQYKLIHLRLEAKMAASVRERILRAMFVNSKRFATMVQTSSEVVDSNDKNRENVDCTCHQQVIYDVTVNNCYL